MKINKQTIGSLILLIIISSLYRIIPGRPLGFAPQIAMALFAGSVILDRKSAFIVPILSMLISDIFYQVLFINGLSNIPGFYSGQIINYALFGLITSIGFGMRQNITSIISKSFMGAIFYFIASNFMVWLTSGMYQLNINGLINCYYMGVPFFTGSLVSTVIFNFLLFIGYNFSKFYDFRTIESQA